MLYFQFFINGKMPNTQKIVGAILNSLKMKTLLKIAAVTAVSISSIRTYAQNIFPSSGRTGIYTNTPVASLQVAGGARFGRPSQYLDVDSATGNLSFGGNASLRVGGNKYAFQYAGNPNYGLFFNSTNTRYEFRNNAAAPIFYINANTGAGTFSGNVGVAGATAADFALNVNSSASYGGIRITDPADNMIFTSTKTGINSAAFLSKTNTTSGTATLYCANSGTGAGVYGQSTSGSGVYGYSLDATAVFGYSYNSYGMYASSLNYRALYAEGSSNYYTAYFNGDIYSTGNYIGSDAKLKKNIEDVNNAMDIIKQLKPKHYEYRSDGNYGKMKLPKGNHYGLIAQDVEKILPQIIREGTYNTRDSKPRTPSAEGSEEDAKAALLEKNETIDFKAVNYTELIPILVKALQEQDAKIEALIKELHENKTSQSAATAVETISAITAPLATSIKVIPNPAKSIISVMGLNKTGTLNIIDIQGRQLFHTQITAEVSRIDVSAFSKGTYIIQYQDKGKAQTVKFIKE